MATFYDANTICNQIHNLVQTSGLHFVINQTPWSSYITIRRKFVGPAPTIKPTLGSLDLGTSEQNEKLKQQIIALENAVVNAEEETMVAEHRADKVVQNLHLKIDDLEHLLSSSKFNLKQKELEITAVEKEIKKKDDIIQNLNDGFNKKVIDLKEKVTCLEKFKKEVFKRERKVLKKLKQKSKKNQEKHSPVTIVNGDLTNNNDPAEDDLEQNYSCELCGELLKSNKQEEHAREVHHEELSQVAKIFEDQNVESQKLLENVTESEYILTPEEITHFGVDWEIHLKVCDILNLENNKKIKVEE